MVVMVVIVVVVAEGVMVELVVMVLGKMVAQVELGLIFYLITR